MKIKLLFFSLLFITFKCNGQPFIKIMLNNDTLTAHKTISNYTTYLSLVIKVENLSTKKIICRMRKDGFSVRPTITSDAWCTDSGFSAPIKYTKGFFRTGISSVYRLYNIKNGTFEEWDVDQLYPILHMPEDWRSFRQIKRDRRKKHLNMLDSLFMASQVTTSYLVSSKGNAIAVATIVSDYRESDRPNYVNYLFNSGENYCIFNIELPTTLLNKGLYKLDWKCSLIKYENYLGDPAYHNPNRSENTYIGAVVEYVPVEGDLWIEITDP